MCSNTGLTTVWWHSACGSAWNSPRMRSLRQDRVGRKGREVPVACPKANPDEEAAGADADAAAPEDAAPPKLNPSPPVEAACRPELDGMPKPADENLYSSLLLSPGFPRLNNVDCLQTQDREVSYSNPQSRRMRQIPEHQEYLGRIEDASYYPSGSKTKTERLALRDP